MSGGELVLVAEDNHDVRSFVVMTLTSYGFRVIEAGSGWQALQVAENTPPDILLLDWQLPDITGLDVLRALRAGGCMSPAILMTGYGSEDLAIVALRLGARDYLTKPFSAEELTGAVETALAETRLRRERDALLAQLAEAIPWRDQYARQLTIAKSYLYRLALLTERMKLNREQNWAARIEEAQSYIRKIAEVMRGLPPPARK